MSEALTSLTDLAAEANRNHQLAETTAGKALEYARLSGAALNEAKSQVKHGEWLPWLAENFHATCRTAQKYMVLASNTNCDSYLEAASINEALRMIAGEDEEDEAEEIPEPFIEGLADLEDGRVSEMPDVWPDEPFPEEEEAQHVEVEVVGDDETEESPVVVTPEVSPERGVAIVYARTALDALNKIPKRDPSRKAAIQMIADWLEQNT